MLANLKRFARVMRQEGLRNAVFKTIRYLGRQAATATPVKRDIIGYYGFLLGAEQGAGSAVAIKPGSMCWVIPDFNASSGGHINIVRMMQLLAERGFPDQHLVIVEPHRWSSVADAKAALDSTFGASNITVSLGARSIRPSEFVVATGWQTAYWVAKYQAARQKIYFVQDFEPAFYPLGTEYALAEETYRQNLIGITAGSWLAKKLHDEYGMKTISYSFACDLDHYRPMPSPPRTDKRVMFYARPVTPRRCFELGVLALNRICQEHPDVTVVFVGWDVSDIKIPFRHVSLGSIDVADLPELYSSCDAALVLSSTNLSLLPLEVTSCGCPVVMNRGPHADWLLTEGEAYYCDLTVEGISKAVGEVLADPVEAKRRVQAAAARTRSLSWETEADKIASFLRTL